MLNKYLQKAAKQQAIRNAATLKRTHFLSLSVNAIYLLLRLLLFRASSSRASLFKYVAFSIPAFAIELWLERIGRPTISQDGNIRKAGEDLDAKGMTEFLWDVLYWSWGCTVLAAALGDRLWWLWAVIPVYSMYLGFTTLGRMRQGMAGLGSQTGGQSGGETGGTSNRQKKMEKRGGQKVQYR